MFGVPLLRSDRENEELLRPPPSPDLLLNPWEAMRFHASPVDSLHLQIWGLFLVSVIDERQPTAEEETATRLQSR